MTIQGWAMIALFTAIVVGLAKPVGAWLFALYGGLSSFAVYFAMFGYRKPFTAAAFSHPEGWPFAVDFKIALVKQVAGSGGEFQGPSGSGVSYSRVGFYMIANDGNIMEHAIPFDGTLDLDGDGNASEHKGMLPTLGIAERYDIIIDFASQGIVAGDKLYLVNVLEHENGQGTSGTVSLSSIWTSATRASWYRTTIPSTTASRQSRRSPTRDSAFASGRQSSESLCYSRAASW